MSKTKKVQATDFASGEEIMSELEEQAVTDRVDPRDAEQVVDQAACPRAPQSAPGRSRTGRTPRRARHPAGGAGGAEPVALPADASPVRVHTKDSEQAHVVIGANGVEPVDRVTGHEPRDGEVDRDRDEERQQVDRDLAGEVASHVQARGALPAQEGVDRCAVHAIRD